MTMLEKVQIKSGGSSGGDDTAVAAPLKLSAQQIQSISYQLATDLTPFTLPTGQVPSAVRNFAGLRDQALDRGLSEAARKTEASLASRYVALHTPPRLVDAGPQFMTSYIRHAIVDPTEKVAYLQDLHVTKSSLGRHVSGEQWYRVPVQIG